MKKLSQVGNQIIGSEIIKISQQIKEIAKTKPVQNLTIGDFDPKVNPIPDKLKDGIIQCYEEDLTNYPLSPGELSLRKSVSKYLKKRQGVDYTESEILIGGGVRPLIYTVYKSILDEGDGVVYPVPSWNNNHYTFLHNSIKIPIECKPAPTLRIPLLYYAPLPGILFTSSPISAEFFPSVFNDFSSKPTVVETLTLCRFSFPALRLIKYIIHNVKVLLQNYILPSHLHNSRFSNQE